MRGAVLVLVLLLAPAALATGGMSLHEALEAPCTTLASAPACGLVADIEATETPCPLPGYDACVDVLGALRVTGPSSATVVETIRTYRLRIYDSAYRLEEEYASEIRHVLPGDGPRVNAGVDLGAGLPIERHDAFGLLSHYACQARTYTYAAIPEIPQVGGAGVETSSLGYSVCRVDGGFVVAPWTGP